MLRTGHHQLAFQNVDAPDEATWSFSRASHRLKIHTSETALGFLVTITVDGISESNAFPDRQRAARFRSQMESALFEHGWSFVGFAPDCRSGIDRRRVARAMERRRWWPDG
jgi:hypothetical protein